MKLTKRKIYYLIISLAVAYIPVVFISILYKENPYISFMVMAGVSIWFATLLYGMILSNIITDDHFKSIDELKEEKEKVRALNRKLYNYMQIIGEHEAIKMWNENKNKENEQVTSVDA